MRRLKNIEVEENGVMVKKDISFLQGVSLKNTESIEVSNDTLILNLKSGDSKVYKKIHGTWGFPTIVKY